MQLVAAREWRSSQVATSQVATSQGDVSRGSVIADMSITYCPHCNY